MLVAFAFLRDEHGAANGAQKSRVGVVGGGGGRAVQSADVCEEAGLAVPKLPDAIRESLREKAPQLADWVDNPVDQSILAGSGVSGARILEMMLESDAFDALIANVGERNAPWSRPASAPECATASMTRLATGFFTSPTMKSPAGAVAPPNASPSTNQPEKSWCRKSAKTVSFDRVVSV